MSESKAEIVRKIEELDLKESTEGLSGELRKAVCNVVKIGILSRIGERVWWIGS